jgi:hypothetical protein
LIIDTLLGMTLINENKNHFKTFVWRITATHTIAYFAAGIFALLVLKYNETFGVGILSFMRPTDSSWVAAGAGLQIIRGALLALFLYPFSTIFINTKKGWVKFWLLSFGLSYLLTFSAAIGSFEGFIYTNFPMRYHLLGIPEVLLYLTLFTILMWGWYKKPKKIFNTLSVISVLLIALMSAMGALASLGIIETA